MIAFRYIFELEVLEFQFSLHFKLNFFCDNSPFTMAAIVGGVNVTRFDFRA